MQASARSTRRHPGALPRYAVAVGAAALALALTMLVLPILHEPLFSFFYIAVFISSWYGGLGPGLLATLLSIILADYYILSPTGSFLLDIDTIFRLGVEVSAAILISSLTAARRRVEATLRDQREHLQVTLASIGDAVITTDEHGRVTFLNGVAEGLTGWPLGLAVGKDIAQVFQVVDSGTRQPAENPVSRVLREHATVGLGDRTRLVARDGAERPIDDSASPIKDPAGLIRGVVLVFRDITARLQAEAALQASRDQLDVILRGIADGVVAEGPNGNLLYANDAAAQVIGYTSVRELLDHSSPDRLRRFEIMDEHGQPLPASQLPGRQVFQGEEHAARVVRYRVVASGQERWAMVQARPVRDARGQVEMAIVVMQDITAQKHAEAERSELLAREQAARAAAEAAKRRATFLADAGRILASSIDYPTTLTNVVKLAVPEVADWCGVYVLTEKQEIALLAAAHVDPAKVALAHELYRRYPPALNAPSGVGAVLRSGQPQLISDIPDSMLVAAARDATHLEQLRAIGIASIMTLPLNARSRALGALTFVSSRSERTYGPEDLPFAEELALRAAQAIDNARLYHEAQQAVRQRDQFLSLAAHELKTPLTALTGQAQLLQRRAEREGQLNPRDQRTVQIINEQVARLNKLIAALLDISRLETGQLAIERAPIDLCELVRRVVGEVQLTEEDREIGLRCPAGPLPISGDALRLEQVVHNLLQNALKYSQAPAPIVVTVEAQQGQACVAVQDYGMGIPANALARLFQRFYRAENAEEQHISGMGIGLYVVKEISTLHGGTVKVDSAEGAGSCFTICLPLALGTAEDHDSDASEAA